jgi:hypothetical protein
MMDLMEVMGVHVWTMAVLAVAWLRRALADGFLFVWGIPAAGRECATMLKESIINSKPN